MSSLSHHQVTSPEQTISQELWGTCERIFPISATHSSLESQERYPEEGRNEIWKGDVVVSQSLNNEPAVQYYGYASLDGDHERLEITPKHRADNIANNTQSLFDSWYRHYSRGRTDSQTILEQILTKRKTSAPDSKDDVLFKPQQRHKGDRDCLQCKKDYENAGYRTREEQKCGKAGLSYKIRVHRGMILTGNFLVRNPDFRDNIKSQFPSALCVDMESAAVMNDWHPLVIRGISDYADSHYGWKWTTYAAAAAAAVAKDIIRQIQPDHLLFNYPLPGTFGGRKHRSTSATSSKAGE